MGMCSEHAAARTVWFSRLFATIAVFAAGISMAPEDASGQSISCKELVADMAAQQKMIGTFRTLDYQIREHFLIVANAILSTYGGWNTKPGWASNAAQLKDSTADFEQQVFVVKRDIGRSKTISEEELQRLNGILDNFSRLIETGDQIAKEIDAGRVDDANRSLYFETARPIYLQAHGNLYTLITTAERRMASMARKPCS